MPNPSLMMTSARAHERERQRIRVVSAQLLSSWTTHLSVDIYPGGSAPAFDRDCRLGLKRILV